MATKDKELDAISSIMQLLKPLDATERSRVLEYVLRRLEMATVSAPALGGEAAPQESSSPTAPSRFPIKDIRSLTGEKQPRSANEMAALVAYYLADLAGEGERSDTINVDAIRRYFKMAGFPLPRVLKNVLTNAYAAGYFDNVSRGEYRLNPVGYNLVVHGLPKGGSGGSVTAPRASRRRAAKPRSKRKGSRK